MDSIYKSCFKNCGYSIVQIQTGFSIGVNQTEISWIPSFGDGLLPKLVTVITLIRSTGNHLGPKINGGLQAEGSNEIINNINIVLEYRLIQIFVEKTALVNVGFQI
ncbi:MAG: hypothetical protein MRJ93_03795 [Nitrososphaeraceae archaeon]|nr:hypothetical protein [Nitrososphaeraceae archaeon]